MATTQKFRWKPKKKPIAVTLRAFSPKTIIILMLIERTTFFLLTNAQGTLNQAIRDVPVWFLWFTVISASFIYQYPLKRLKGVLGINYLDGNICVYSEDLTLFEVKEIEIPSVYRLFTPNKYPDVAAEIESRLGSNIWNYYLAIIVGVVLIIVGYFLIGYNELILGKDGFNFYNVENDAPYHTVIYLYAVPLVTVFSVIILNILAIMAAYFYLVWKLGDIIIVKREKEETASPSAGIELHFAELKRHSLPLTEIISSALVLTLIPLIILFLGASLFLLINPFNFGEQAILLIAGGFVAVFLLVLMIIPLVFIIPQLSLARFLRRKKAEEIDKLEMKLWENERKLIDTLTSNTIESKEEKDRVFQDIKILENILKRNKAISSFPSDLGQNLRIVVGLALAGFSSLIPFLLQLLGL